MKVLDPSFDRGHDLEEPAEVISAIARCIGADAISNEVERRARRGEHDVPGLFALVARLRRYLREQRRALWSRGDANAVRVAELTRAAVAAEQAIHDHQATFAEERARLAARLAHARTKLVMSCTADLLEELTSQLAATEITGSAARSAAIAFANELVHRTVARWRGSLRGEVTASIEASCAAFAHQLRRALDPGELAVAITGARISIASAYRFQPIPVAGTRLGDVFRPRAAVRASALELASIAARDALDRNTRSVVDDELHRLEAAQDALAARLRDNAHELAAASRAAAERAEQLRAGEPEVRDALISLVDEWTDRVYALECQLAEPGSA
ncbi:MAG: hypothetical protein ACTHU0_09205 [Kofleriaceae bacterium]